MIIFLAFIAHANEGLGLIVNGFLSPALLKCTESVQEASKLLTFVLRDGCSLRANGNN